MNIDQLRRRFANVCAPEENDNLKATDCHQTLFSLFTEAENMLAEMAESEPESADQQRIEDVLRLQADILRMATKVRSRLISDVLLKLALWRWHAAELDPPIDELPLTDAVAYSAFLDLANILGDQTVLKDIDCAAP